MDPPRTFLKGGNTPRSKHRGVNNDCIVSDDFFRFPIVDLNLTKTVLVGDKGYKNNTPSARLGVLW